MAASCMLLAITVQGAVLVGPIPYSSSADSPWASYIGTTIVLEDFEDGALNVPGVAATSGGVVIPPYGNLRYIDSVDGDDGLIDGLGRGGHSLYYTPAGSITFDFTSSATLPTHAGIVWTDGRDSITFEAFDSGGISLGTLTGNHADGIFTGTTAEDRFYGVWNVTGISAIKISNPGGMEVDHLQFGTVPEPSAYAVLAGFGLMALAGYRRCRK